MVRTPRFQCGNPGSIPGGATKRDFSTHQLYKNLSPWGKGFCAWPRGDGRVKVERLDTFVHFKVPAGFDRASGGASRSLGFVLEFYLSEVETELVRG